MFEQSTENYNLKILLNEKSSRLSTCHFKWWTFGEWQKNSIWPSCVSSNAPSSIRSWILLLNAQQMLVSCPGLLEWYAHLASGLYLGEAMLGFLGGSLNVTRFNLNRCCKAWDSDMLSLVNFLLGIFGLLWSTRCLWQGCCWTREVVAT